MSKKLDRRSFLKGATATAAASSLGFPALVTPVVMAVQH